MPSKNLPNLTHLLNREVWVVTAAAGGRRSGLTATWVVPASLDPTRPNLLLGLGPNHFTTELVLASQRFAAHLLRNDQGELAWDFARGSGRERDKFTTVELEPTVEPGPPVLKDCLAWWDCRVIATYSTGDRRLVWGEAISGGGAAAIAPGEPRPAAELALREQAFFAHLSDDQRRLLKSNRDADRVSDLPLHEAWRRSVQP